METNSTVKIVGRQLSITDEPTILELPAAYNYKNGSHYIRYDEENSRNTIKISPCQVMVSKSGQVSARLDYIVDEEANCVYQTPVGLFSMRISTKSIRTTIDLDNTLHTEILYDQTINEQEIRDCSLEITLTHKK